MPRSTKGRLIHQEQIEPKKYLLSKRLDLTKYQYEHSWDFFDALNNTKEAIIARKNNETSIKGNNLDKYLSITRTLETQKNKVIEEKKNNIIPEPFNKLLKLQHFNGSFESLSDVKQVLFLPNSIEYIRNNNYNEIEKATALAIAAMRQEYKLFNLLVDSHDKACKWITTNELVYEAREIIVKYQFTGEYSNENYGNSCRNSKCISPLNSNNNNNNSYNNNSDTTINQENPNNEEYHSNSNDNIIQIDSPVSNNHSYKVTDYNISETNDVHDVGAAFSRKEKSKMLEISTTIPQHSRNKNLSRIRNTSRQKSQSPIKSHKYKSQRSVGKYSDSIALKPIVSGDNDSPRSTSSSNSQYSALSQQLQKLTISRDEAKIARHKQYMDQIQVHIVELFVMIEKRLQEVFECNKRCVNAYQNSPDMTTRYKTFNELTCRLGDGFEAAEGYLDYRKDGVAGMRSIVVDFLCHIQSMAEARLLLEELETPNGRDINNIPSVERNKSRWTILWNGKDMVLHVLHGLDSLRKCRELSEWYGPAFYFVANPLMLPFPYASIYEKLEMIDKVEDQVNSFAHMRRGAGIIEEKVSWKHVQFLNKWRRMFKDLCDEQWYFNWPSLPIIKEDYHNERLYTAMLVLYIKCEDSISKSNTWERSFIAMLNTKRGQKELIGISTTKIEQRKITPPLQKGVTTLTTTETFKFKEFVKDFNDNVATMNLPNKRNYMRSKSTSRSSRRNTSRGNSIVSKSDSNNNESSDDQRESKLSFKQAALAVLASKKLMKIDTIRRREREISLFAQNSLYGDSELNTNSASNNSGDISDSIVNNTPTKVARNNLSPLNRKNIIMIPNKKAANSEEGQINEKPIAEKKVNRNILKARIFSELIKSRLASGNQMGAKTVEKLPGPTDSGSAENSSSNVLSNNQNDTSKATTLSISRMRAPSTITKGLVGGNRISININAFTSVEEQFKPNSRTPKKSANKGKFSLRSPSSNKRFTGNDSINMSPSRRSSSSPLAAISEVAVKSDNISSSTDMNETVVGSENRISRTSHVISSRLTGSVALKNRTSLIKPNLSNPVRSGKKRNTNIKLTDPLSQNDKTLSKSNSRKNTVGLVSNRSLELITPQDSLISIAEKQSNSLEGSVSSSIGSKSGKASRKRKKFGSKFVDNDDDKYQKIVMSPLSRTGSGTYSVGSDEEETYKDNSKFSLKQESSVDNVDGLDGSSGYKSKGDKKDGKSIRATPKRLTRKIEVQQK